MLKGPALLLFMPAATLLICILLRTPWKLVLLLFFFVPLVASLVAILPPDRGYPVFSTKFLRALMGVYVFAVMSSGYFAPLIGSIALWVARLASLPARLTPVRLLVGGVVIGALVGSAVMMGLDAYWAGFLPEQQFLQGFLIWAFTGLAAGAVSGALIAVYLQNGAGPENQPA